jgi:hypothetical protein
MYRSSKRTGIRSYATGLFPAYLAPQGAAIASLITTKVEQTEECKVINEQKNKLLTSLASYFASEKEKDDLKVDLRDIKSTLVKECPTYTQTNVNACC